MFSSLLAALVHLGFILLLVPKFVHAGLFPKSSLVKMIDAKEFKEVMKLNVRVVYMLRGLSHCKITANQLGRFRSAMVWGMSLSTDI